VHALAQHRVGASRLSPLIDHCRISSSTFSTSTLVDPEKPPRLSNVHVGAIEHAHDIRARRTPSRCRPTANTPRTEAFLFLRSPRPRGCPSIPAPPSAADPTARPRLAAPATSRPLSSITTITAPGRREAQAQSGVRPRSARQDRTGPGQVVSSDRHRSSCGRSRGRGRKTSTNCDQRRAIVASAIRRGSAVAVRPPGRQVERIEGTKIAEAPGSCRQQLYKQSSRQYCV
jgi:hypothetical protein